MAKSKYHAKKVWLGGIQFDSKHEAERYVILKEMQRVGEISDLRLQVEFELIPAQYAPDTVGKRGGIRKGKLLERKCCYIADFVYTDKDGSTVVEDTKGFRTPDYIIKRKLMRYIHGIAIREI